MRNWLEIVLGCITTTHSGQIWHNSQKQHFNSGYLPLMMKLPAQNTLVYIISPERDM